MEGAAAAIVTHVGQLAGEEFWLLSGVRGQVFRLRDELATMNALLRMQSEAEEGAVDHFIREWMKQLREVAYDAEDCVDLYFFRVRGRSGRPCFIQCKHVFRTLLSRHRLASDIKDLRAYAASINEQHARYGVNLDPLRRPPSAASLPSSVRSYAHALRPAHDPNQLVGIGEQASFLVEKVKAASCTADEELLKVKVVSVVGFAGLGKTTLVMEVCRQLEADFPRQAQVSVSQVLDLRRLLKQVLHQIVDVKAQAGEINRNESLAGIDNMDMEELRENIHAILEKNRFLIVIDDVWTEAAWHAIRSMLPDDNKYISRIIVTTRIDSVARACSNANDDYIHHIKALSEESSKLLFISRTFGSETPSCPKDLEDCMDKVLKKCCGLPLAIVSIASLLASYKSPESKHMWETILKSIGSQMESHPSLEGMRKIITLSFDHLPHHLKSCMMYLSIFPEDYVIFKDRLLRRWIAEGLVAQKRGLTLMEVAEEYFDELVSRSMIDRVPDKSSYYDGREERCRVHDMMLEVMVSKSLEANFVSLIGGQYEGMSYDRPRRLSVHGRVDASKESSQKNNRAGKVWRKDNARLNVQHVRSFSMFELEKNKLFDQLDEFTLLRVLDLEDCMGLQYKHLVYICRMYLLRFLNLKGTDISKLPREVGELEHLQTLDVRHTKLQGLPERVTKLEKLESLLFSGKSRTGRWMPPMGLRKMTALRKLRKVVVSSETMVAKEIGELNQLQELDIYVDGNNTNDVVKKDLNLSLGRLYALQNLNIGDVGFDKEALLFLHDLTSPPQLLRYLRICGGLLGERGLPNWVRQLNNLVEFVLGWAFLEGDEPFDSLCKLPNLKRLRLEPSFYLGGEIVAKKTHSFAALKELKVSGYQLLKVHRFEEGTMPEVETLILDGFDHETSFLGIENLTKLNEVQISGKKGKPALDHQLVLLKEENEKREGNQLTVKVRYDDPSTLAACWSGWVCLFSRVLDVCFLENHY